MNRGGWEGDSLAGLADFTLGALPTCPPQRGHGHVQAYPVVVLTTAGAEELVQQVPWAVTQRATHVVYNWAKTQDSQSVSLHEGALQRATESF